MLPGWRGTEKECIDGRAGASRLTVKKGLDNDQVTVGNFVSRDVDPQVMMQSSASIAIILPISIEIGLALSYREPST